MLLLRLKVTSRKLMICLLASIVMRSPFWLKARHISFLMFSVSLGAALEMARPSSLYSPMSGADPGFQKGGWMADHIY